MTLVKTTNDNSVLYVSKVDQSLSERTSPTSKEGKKNASNINLSQKYKKDLKNLAPERFRTLKE